MAGVAYTLEARGLDAALTALKGYADGVPARLALLADAAGALIESSVKARLGETKRAPDGAAWDPWSERYGATRRPGQSLLEAEGDLRDSIQALTSPAEVRVGSNLVYAAIHQFGGADVGRNIPARPYLGLSGEDERGVTDLAEGFLRGGLA